MKLIIGTPVYDHQVSFIYHQTQIKLLQHRPFELLPVCFGDELTENHNHLTKARASIVRRFLKETDGDGLLCQDSDVGCEPAAIEGMCGLLMPGFDYIACTYRRKHSGPSTYTYLLEERRLPLKDKPLLEVDGVGLGLTLLSRRLLEDLTKRAFESDKIYVDDDGHEVADLFDLMRDEPTRKKLSEDYSFCRRVRGAGHKVWMYLGPGAPAAHAGQGVFEGDMSEILRPARAAPSP